jgi:hypothetical protein
MNERETPQRSLRDRAVRQRLEQVSASLREAKKGSPHSRHSCGSRGTRCLSRSASPGAITTAGS